jgi:hypothetical protein
MFLIVGISFSQPEVTAQKQLLEAMTKSPIPLAKTTVSAATMTSYTNSTFNVTYTAPTGWSFNTPTVIGTTAVTWTATSPSYSAQVYIWVFNDPDSLFAATYSQAVCFNAVSTVYKNELTTQPWIDYLVDTFYVANNFGEQAIYVVFNTSQSILVLFANHCGQYVDEIFFSTTVADFNTNVSVYLQNYLNLLFINLYPTRTVGGLSKTAAFEIMKPYATTNGIVLPSAQGKQMNVSICDLLGRKIAGMSLNNSNGQTFLPKTGAAYILQMKEQGQQQNAVVPFAR